MRYDLPLSLAWDSPSFDHHHIIYASTPLTTLADYVPGKQVRSLLADPWGERATARYAYLRRFATLPSDGVQSLARSAADDGVWRRLQQLNATVRGDVAPQPVASVPSSRQHYVPSKGAPWPHWSGQLSIKCVMELQPFPRDELPPQVRSPPRRWSHASPSSASTRSLPWLSPS